MELIHLLEDDDIRKSIDEFEAYVQSRLKTFANFPLRESNRFAHAAAQEVALDPGKRNPLVLYGKHPNELSHLLQAIQNAYAEKRRHACVALVSADSFVNRFCDCRNADVLLFDGIHRLITEEQHAFLQVFQMLYDGGRQMVITADRSPKDLAKDACFVDKLLVRLMWGLTIELR